MLRTLALIPLAALALAAPATAGADPHRGQITVESWSLPASTAGGTGKTMTAALLGNAAAGSKVTYSDLLVVKSLDKP